MLRSVLEGRGHRLILAALPVALSGCATLPSSGPTAAQVQSAETSSANTINFRVVRLTPQAIAEINRADEAAMPATPPFATLDRRGAVDAVGPGDVLGINVFEVGVTLFGGQANFGGEGSFSEESFNPTARGRALGGVVVNENGTIRLPYIGDIKVAGLTPPQIEKAIEGKFSGKSQNAQVIVTVRENVVNTVYVSGAVNRPGRFPLTLARERLLDALAVSGGPSSAADSMVVRFTRKGQTVEERLSAIRTGSPLDLTLLPGDRIELILRPKSFSVFGATAKVSQVAFKSDRVSLAEALAEIGGPSDQQADPRGIFLFRYTRAQMQDPVIYRLDLMNPTNYFLAQQLQMHDKDVVYIANAPANLPTKFIGVLNQLFSPFLTARVLLDSNN